MCSYAHLQCLMHASNATIGPYGGKGGIEEEISIPANMVTRIISEALYHALCVSGSCALC